MIEVSR